MKVWLAWSSGKDSARALHVARRQRDVEVVGLLTTVTGDYERVSMHGVREALLARQAKAAGLPLRPVVIPAECTNALYEEAMERAMADARAQGVEAVVFGDLFLADVRAYREKQMARAGMGALFPLWGRDTAALVFDGPMFSRAIPVEVGETVERGGFVFTDVLPVECA